MSRRLPRRRSPALVARRWPPWPAAARRLRRHPGRRRRRAAGARQPRHGHRAPAATGAPVTAPTACSPTPPAAPCPRPAHCRPARTMAQDPQARPPRSPASRPTRYLLGARNPVTGQIEGFDIDMVHAVAQAIFGDPNKIELRVITAAAADPAAAGRQRRHRRPQHDDQLRPLEARSPSPAEYYRVRPEGPGPRAGSKRHRGSPTSTGKKVCAPNGSTSWTS